MIAQGRVDRHMGEMITKLPSCSLNKELVKYEVFASARSMTKVLVSRISPVTDTVYSLYEGLRPW